MYTYMSRLAPEIRRKRILQTLSSSILNLCLKENEEALYYWFEILSRMSLRKNDEQSFSSLSYLKFSSFWQILTMLRNELWFWIQHIREYKFRRDTAIYFVKVLSHTHLIKGRRRFFDVYLMSLVKRTLPFLAKFFFITITRRGLVDPSL
jgi:hypothetical protein